MQKLLPQSNDNFFFLFFYDFIYLFMNRHTKRQRHRQREKQAPLREPDVGLDPWTPGPQPEPKAELNHWAIQASLVLHILNLLIKLAQFS